MTSQERVLKINKVIWTTKSRVIHAQISVLKQYQMMMSSVARVRFIKVTQSCLKPSLIKFGSRNQKFCIFKFHYQNGKKRKSWKNFSVLQKGAMKGLKIRAGFRDYKLGQEGLQIGAALGISNRGKKIANRGRDYKSGQEGFQNGAGITNRCRRRRSLSKPFFANFDFFPKTFHFFL